MEASTDIRLTGARAARVVPRLRAGTVERTALVRRLVEADTTVVAVVAPAGYGKTTVLAQWCERDPRACTWISLGSGGTTHPAVIEAALRRLGRRPALVAVDGIEALQATQEVRALDRLVAALPPGSTVALAGRAEPALPLGRLRAEGALLELGPLDLALTRAETHELLHAAGADVTEAEVAEVHRRTEGWPVGVHLAALGLRAGGAAHELGGDDAFVADYLREQHLAQLPPAERRFLLETSVLAELSGPLCDAVLGRADSTRRLDALARRNGFLVPLDRGRHRFRYHRLFRECLRTELDRRDPARAAELSARAAEWCDANGAPAAAVEYAAAAGDLERTAALVERHALEELHAGRVSRVESWLRLVDDTATLERRAGLCAVGAWVHASRGRPADAQHWADAGETAAAGDARALALPRAVRCHRGAAQMLVDAETAAELLAPTSPWRPVALLALGVSTLLAGDAARADAVLCQAVEAAAAAGAADCEAVALAERCLIAEARGEHAEADALAADAGEAACGLELGASLSNALERAVAARAALRRGDLADARAALAQGLRARHVLTHALPWLAVQARLELAHASIGLADGDGARALLAEVENVFRRRPGLGTLHEEAAELRRQVVALREPGGRWAASLTPAEARLLPLLATHLSFREIGERLFVSRNTVKTQAISVYRKFGVSSRGDAVSRAADLGLLDASTALRRGDGGLGLAGR